MSIPIRFLIPTVLLALIIPFTQCTKGTETKMNLSKKPFGKLPDGAAANIYTLTNDNGTEVRITNYGGTIVSLKTPDRDGRSGDIVLGFPDLAGYLQKGNPYFGAIIGRYADNISFARFSLDGVTYDLPKNNGDHHLHGGLKGFDKKVWDVAEIRNGDSVGIELSYLSRDGEEGYPGNLRAAVTYRLNNDNELTIDYRATTDKPTIVSLTNHSYFNLAGAGNGDVHGIQLMINADKHLELNKDALLTGKLRDVKGTPMDFNRPRPIGDGIASDYDQVRYGTGYDHYFLIRGEPGQMRPAASAYDPGSGRALELRTTAPGLQLYTSNFLDGTLTGKDDKVYNKHYAFCLETESYPDSPNHPEFPTSSIKPGEEYRQTSIFKFSIR